MSEPVDLTNLRTMTDGEKELELALFEEFYSSSEQVIAAMAANCVDGQNETWRTSAHALKGSAYNIGAMALGELCKQGQDNPAAPAAEKQALLEKIKAEYAQVKAFLQKTHA